MLEYKRITEVADPYATLKQVFEIDKAVYSPELCGTFKNLCVRYEKCKDAFILVYDGDKLAGYVTFVLAGEELYKELTDPASTAMRDDDITPDEMVDWCEGEGHHLFIISIAVHPEFQGGGTVKLLAKSLLAFLREKEEAGFRIDSISGSAVSGGGASFLRRLHAVYEKEVDGGYLYHRATRPAVERLLTNGLVAYEKTYDNDIFFFLPMTAAADAENVLERMKQQQAEMEIEEDSYPDVYCKLLNHHVEYECNILDSGELQRVYLGKFRLACYDDNYELGLDEEADTPDFDFDFLQDEETGKQYFYAEDYDVDAKQRDKKRILHAAEDVYLFVTAHEKSGIYIVTVALPDNRYIPTQLIDQMSTEHMDLVIDGKLVPIAEYMKKHYSLYLYGESKCVVCLSKNPKSRTELGYLLAGETYVSSAIDYQIRPERLEEFLKPRAYYDYYDSYISRSVIAFVFKEYSPDFAVRLDDETSELFITEVVLLQNTAVVRTNRHVAEELSEKNGISSKEIENLYLEFGKTIKFWRSDVFKYPGSQLEADEVVRSFGIKEALDEYYRNQSFLDRLVEIRGTIAVREAKKVSEKAQEESERASKRMNDILYILACIESVSIIAAGIMAILGAYVQIDSAVWNVWIEISLTVALAFACFLGYKFIYRRKIDKKIKKKK